VPISRQPLELEKARVVKPAGIGGQTAHAHGSRKMQILKQPEIGKWKLAWQRIRGVFQSKNVTFDMLFDKYSKQNFTQNNTPNKRPLREIGH
jgi:hypothetical protein